MYFKVIHITCVNEHRQKLHKILYLPTCSNERVFNGDFSCILKIIGKERLISDTGLSQTEGQILFLQRNESFARLAFWRRLYLHCCFSSFLEKCDITIIQIYHRSRSLVNIVRDDKCIAHLLQSLHTNLYTILLTYISELSRLCIKRLIHDIQLVFDALSAFGSKVYQLKCLFVRHVTIRINQLHHARKCFPNSQVITFRKGTIKLSIILQ